MYITYAILTIYSILIIQKVTFLAGGRTLEVKILDSELDIRLDVIL
jgi:hypothetical protein